MSCDGNTRPFGMAGVTWSEERHSANVVNEVLEMGFGVTKFPAFSEVEAMVEPK